MSQQHDQLLQECIDLFAKQLVEALHSENKSLKKAIEDRLLAENSAERRKILESLQERINSGWRGFCQKFHERLLYESLLKAGLTEPDEDVATDRFSSLTLVDDAQMESDLALAGFGSRVMSAAGIELGEFAGRVNALARRPAGDDELRNPLDTPVLVAALKPALDTLVPEADLQRTMLVLLDPPLSALLKQEFGLARDWLADQGVEVITRVRQSATARPGGSGSGTGSGEGIPDGMLGILQQFMQNVGGMFTGGAGPGGGGGLPGVGAGGVGGVGGVGGAAGGAAGGSAIPGGMIAVPAAMLESLNRFQSLDLSALQSGAPLQTDGVNNNVLRELRQHDSVRSLPPIEAVTIDIVATLFDFIFDDALVPDSVKALVGRLQIPLLKVAMLDKSFFSNKEHPARALLNEISRASISAGKHLSQGDPIFEKIRAVVGRVLAESEKEQGVFAEVLPEIKALVAQQLERSDLLAEKTKQVAERQEQHDIAESAAGEAFVRILEGGINDEVPSHIADFLTRKYPLVMKRALLNGGTAGAAWSLATQTLSDLLWTMTPKATSEERQRMVKLIPDLLRRLNAFFEKVGVSADEKSAFVDALAQQHSKVIKGLRKSLDRPSSSKPDGAAVAGSGETVEIEQISPMVISVSGVIASQSMGPTVVVTRIVQEDGVEVETMSVSGRAAGTRPTKSLGVSGIKRGDWVEFLAENGDSLRARLSWTSPARGVMLFTNPQSSKAVSISPEAMAIQLKRGQAKILGDDPMMERALSKAMDSMKAA